MFILVDLWLLVLNIERIGVKEKPFAWEGYLIFNKVIPYL